MLKDMWPGLTREDTGSTAHVHHDGILEHLRVGQDEASIRDCTGGIAKHDLVNVCPVSLPLCLLGPVRPGCDDR